MARILLTRSLKKPASEDNPIWPAKKYSKNKRQPRKIIPAAHKDKARTCDDVDNRVELRAGATCHPVTERAKLFPLPSLSNANLRNFSRERRKKMGWTPRTAVQGGGGGRTEGGVGWAVETTLAVRAVLSSHWRESRKCLRSKKFVERYGIDRAVAERGCEALMAYLICANLLPYTRTDLAWICKGWRNAGWERTEEFLWDETRVWVGVI